MKRIVTFLLTFALMSGNIGALAEEVPAAGINSYSIELSKYNIYNDSSEKNITVTVKKNGAAITPSVIQLDDADSSATVTSNVQGIHKVTAVADGKLLTTYFSYTDKTSACAIKDKNAVFFEDFNDTEYEGDGAADFVDATKWTGRSSASIFRYDDPSDQDFRPNNPALQVQPETDSIQSQPFGPTLADYAVEYKYRGMKNTTGSMIFGTTLGMRFSPTDNAPNNAYRLIHAPRGYYTGGPSSLGTSGTQYLDIWAIGRSGKDNIRNSAVSYRVRGITTALNSTETRQWTAAGGGEKPITYDNYAFANRMYYNVHAYIFSDTMRVQVISPDENDENPIKHDVRGSINSTDNLRLIDYSNKVDIASGRTVISSEAYNFRIDDLAIYKLYNMKRLDNRGTLTTVKEGEPLIVGSVLSGRDNNPGGGDKTVDIAGKSMKIYTEGLGASYDSESSAVTFSNSGSSVVAMEVTGYNGVKKAYVHQVTVTADSKLTVSNPRVTCSEPVAGALATAVCHIKNTSSETKNAVLYAVVYDGDERLVSVSQSDTMVFSPNTESDMSTSVTLPESYNADYSVKAFIWDDELVPLAVEGTMY